MSEPLKIYLDDIRATPEGWTRCYKIEEVQEFLKKEVVTNMSLDHDLGASYLCSECYDLARENSDCADNCTCLCHESDPIEGPNITPTGYDLVKWMAENDLWSVYPPTVHSANPVGRANMQATIDRYWHPKGTTLMDDSFYAK